MTPILAAAREPGLLESLTEEQWLVLPFLFAAWLRPDQHIPDHAWRYCIFHCGRGWGKSWVIAREINRRVLAGEATCIALQASNEARTDEIQIQFLIDTSPPWFKAERYDGGVRWPNGVRAYVFTPEAPEVPRGGNFDCAWLCELVAWPESTAKASFDNITTGTRIGAAQVFVDTTSKGRKKIILDLFALARRDPKNYPIVRGSMFDNGMLSDAYLRAELIKYPPGKRRDEEIDGAINEEEEGALWAQEWIDRARKHAPPKFVVEIVSCDPGLSTYASSDDTGIIRGGLEEGGDVTITKDLSGKFTPEQWGDILIDQCIDGCSGITIERNRGGDLLVANIRARAEQRARQDNITLNVVELPDDNKPFPRRVAGVIYVRQKKTQDTKETRAYAPASHTEAGRVHLLNKLTELEDEMTSWVPGSSRSPNRLDAAVYLILELSGLERNQPKVKPKKHTQQTVAAGKILQGRLRTAFKRKVVGFG